MKSPFGLVFPIIAGLAAAVAVWAGPNYELAGPAVVIAVGAAALAFFEVVLGSTGRPVVTMPRRPRYVPGVQDLFLAGAAARTEIVGLLDQIDREGDHPDRPLPTPAELHRLGTLSEPEFLQYVRGRLDALEGNA